ncbi:MULTISPECIES: hypothetical protein [Staphylococcus]
MKYDALTHILLLIVGLLLLANGILSFDKTIAMSIVSIIFIIVGLIIVAFGGKLIYDNKFSNSKSK